MKNIQLTKNFKLFEFIHAQMSAEALVMNFNALNRMSEQERNAIIENIKCVALEMQKIRDKYKLPITITSGYRCIEWEKHRGRSGTSQHIQGLACDFILADQKIMKQIEKDYMNFMGGFATCIRNGKYVFAHIDLRSPEPQHFLRGYGARWPY